MTGRIERALVMAALGGLIRISAEAGDRVFSELRLGAPSHDVHCLGGRENRVDSNAESLFVSPFAGSGKGLPGWVRRTAEPRPMAGGSGNSAGQTSQGYAGIDGSDRKALGSNVPFRPGAEIGCQVALEISLYVLFDRASDADMSHYNEGLNDPGVRVGLRF